MTDIPIIGARRLTVFTCRGCGCDDNHACPGGCSWTLLDRPEPGEELTGICSACAQACGFHQGVLAQIETFDRREFARVLKQLERSREAA